LLTLDAPVPPLDRPPCLKPRPPAGLSRSPGGERRWENAPVRVLAIVHQRDAGPGVFTDRIRARGTLETWYPAEEPEPPDPEGFGAALTFGGAMHADQGADHAWIATELSLISRLLDLRVPTLGVCLGTQLLAAAAGAEVTRAAEPEIGWREVELTGAGAADPVLG